MFILMWLFFLVCLFATFVGFRILLMKLDRTYYLRHKCRIEHNEADAIVEDINTMLNRPDNDNDNK